MHRVLTSLLLLAACAARATPATWFFPEQPGAAPAVVQLAADDRVAVRLSGVLRGQGFAYANWRDPSYSAAGLGALLDAGHGIDRSRIALVASGDAARSAIAILASAGAATMPPVRGIALHVDAATDWPELPTVRPWPAMLLTYTIDQPAARDAAFDLAERARVAGAQVWLQPVATADADFQNAGLGSWLSSLKVTRARRFEDALVAPYTGARQETLLAALEAVSPRAADDMAIAHIIDADSGRQSDLVLDPQGRILRVSATATVAEFDARNALRAVYGEGKAAVRMGSAVALSLVHPETGTTVLAMAMTLAMPDGTRSVLMLRHADGSYAYLDLNDDRGIRAMLPSNDAQDHGRVWWVLTERADADGGRLLRIALQAGEPHRGLWWDPSHPGEAIDLQPVQGGHSVVFATYDDVGQSRWYLTSGKIIQDRFDASRDGLQLMRRNPALSLPKRDPQRSGSIAIDFAIDARHPICMQRKAVAAQLALLTVNEGGRSRVWCIEPVTLPAGVPEADVNGTWYGGANDSGWGLTVVASGSGDAQLLSAVLYFHDADGWPRWAMGAARAGAAGAVLVMHDYAQGCIGCTDTRLQPRVIGELRLRTDGWCGRPELRAAFDLAAGNADVLFQRGESPLQRVTQARCD
ncbi:MAG TPA: hypothetical protein PLQ74_09860 [Pseudomonadota bacterium]|nr:hypothetical protein [Xanthomonadales bacterium]HQW82160.1 hypothetical protein [Pseudomonadota bacterium]